MPYLPYFTILAILWSSVNLLGQPQVIVPSAKLWLTENRLQVFWQDCPAEKLRFSSPDAQIRQEGAYLILQPHRPGFVRLDLWQEGLDSLAKHQLQFRALDFSGQTSLKLAGKTGGSIRRQELLQQTFLLAEVDNLGIDLKLGIQHYRLLVLRGGEILFQTKGQSARLDEACRQQLQQVQDGDELHIFNVRALHPGNPPFEVELKGLSLKISH